MGQPNGNATLRVESTPLQYVCKSKARRKVSYKRNSNEKVKLKKFRHRKRAGKKDKAEMACHS